jgi:xylulokinase
MERGRMGKTLLIGMDLGTTNGKVTCYDMEGRVQAEAVHFHPSRMPQPGWYEQEPREWLEVLGQGLREVATQLGPRAGEIAGIAVSNFGPGLVLLDESGEPLAPSPTWQDERCRAQGQKLLDEAGSDWVGLGPPLTGFPAKLLWAVENRPDLMAQAQFATDIKGYLINWLTGQPSTDPSSGPGSNSWWRPVFDYIRWPFDKLPRVVASTNSAGGLLPQVARQVGLEPDIPVFAGVNDGAAATTGSGAVCEGDSVTTLATNGACRLVLSKRLAPETILRRHLFSWPFVGGNWIGGGFTCSGAGSLQWLADLFGIPRDPAEYDRLLVDAAEVAPGSRGIVFVPYLAGRGSPDANPDLRGGFINVGLEHGRPEFARAVLEGIAFAISEVYAEFDRLGYEIGPIRLTGGGARSGLWRQIIANTLNRPVTRAGGDSTLGDAMVAAVGLGLFSDFGAATRSMVHEMAHAEPDEHEVELYQEIFSRYVQTRECLLSRPDILLSDGAR